MRQQHTLQPKLRFPEFEGDWIKKGLNDLGTINRGKSKHRPRNDKRLYGGTIPFIQTGDVNNDKLYITKYTQTYTDFGLSQSKLWDENTLCITIAANIANTSILKFKSCFPDSLIGFIANENNDVVFVKYTFDKIREELKKLSQGVAQDNLNLEKLNSISTLIPSLPEQQKIADYLSTIDTKINLLEEKREQLTRYKKAMMQKLFSQEIRFKDENGNDFGEWEEKRLGDTIVVKVGATPSTSKKEFWDGNIAWINSGELKDGKIYKPSKYMTDLGLKNTSTYLMPKGTVVLAMTGATLGKLGVLMIESAANQSVAGFIPNDSYVNEYLFYYLKHFQNKIFEKAGGAAQIGINKFNIESLKIEFPSLPEQQKIADFLSAIDESIEKVNEQITQTQSFKKAMLQQMFV